MTTKDVGYVELEWSCPRCQTRNPGTQTTCSGCGAPQPKDVKFETPTNPELLTDKDKIARAQQGPDIQCAYCGARNPANAKICHQCGADLHEGAARPAGEVVGAYQTTPAAPLTCPNCGTENPPGTQHCSKCGAPLVKTRPLAAPQIAPAQSGCSWVAIGVAVIVAAVILLFIFLSFRTTELVGTVQDARWKRSLPIEALVPVEYQSWQDQIPGGAEVGMCTQQVRRVQDSPAPNSREVCGTPYTIDTGTGIGKVVQDCQYEVYDDMCSYHVDEWRVVDMVELTGSGFSPEWPVASLQPRQRLGAGHEEYQCVIHANDRVYDYTPSTFAEYQACQPGSQWKLQVNTFNSIMSIEPAQ